MKPGQVEPKLPVTDGFDGYGLGTFSDGNQIFAGLLSGDQVVRLGADGRAPTVRDLLDDWPLAAARLAEIAASGTRGIPVAELKVLPPVVPRQIFQAGANYRAHVAEIFVSDRAPDDTRTDAELHQAAEDWMDERARAGSPFLFPSLPSAVCGPGDCIALPPESHKVDWEVELAVVIGAPARRVRKQHALSYVAGFTVANDISARDLQFPKEHATLGGDWLRAKHRETFLPIGPVIKPAALVSDYRELTLTLDVNGDRKQADHAANMLFDVPALIEAASAVTTLYPGDLILTGSPPGNGGFWKQWLQPGDRLDAAISGIGTLSNTCAAETRI